MVYFNHSSGEWLGDHFLGDNNMNFDWHESWTVRKVFECIKKSQGPMLKWESFMQKKCYLRPQNRPKRFQTPILQIVFHQ